MTSPYWKTLTSSWGLSLRSDSLMGKSALNFSMSRSYLWRWGRKKFSMKSSLIFFF